MSLLLREKQEINEALGLFSLWVADSKKKERCSPTKKMIRFPWNRNNLMLTARASNRQCLTAWQRSRCWWWRSSPTWTWSSARTSSPSTNLCWLHTPNYWQVGEPQKYLLLCDWASPGILGECLDCKEDKAAMKTSSVQFLDKVCVKFHPRLTSRIENILKRVTSQRTEWEKSPRIPSTEKSCFPWTNCSISPLPPKAELKHSVQLILANYCDNPGSNDKKECEILF